MKLFDLIKQQTERIESLQQQLVTLSQHVNGIDLAHALVFELLLSQLPAQKVMIADALSQILSTPDVTATIPNEFCVSLLRSYEKIARNPPRTTPEGRRGWIHVVNPEESSPPEP